MNRYDKDAWRCALGPIITLVGLTLFLVVVLANVGCASRPTVDCTTLKCIEDQARYRQYLACLNSDPTLRVPGRVKVYPGGLPWHVYCNHVVANQGGES